MRALRCVWLCDPTDCSPPGSPGRVFRPISRQEHWSGLPFPPLGGLADPGTEGGFSLSLTTWEALRERGGSKSGWTAKAAEGKGARSGVQRKGGGYLGLVSLRARYPWQQEGQQHKREGQHLGHLMQRTESLEKTLMLGKTEGRRRRGDRGWDGWMASPTRWTWAWASSESWWQTGRPGVLQSMGLQSDTTEWLNWESSSIGSCGGSRGKRSFLGRLHSGCSPESPGIQSQRQQEALGDF